MEWSKDWFCDIAYSQNLNTLPQSEQTTPSLIFWGSICVWNSSRLLWESSIHFVFWKYVRCESLWTVLGFRQNAIVYLCVWIKCERWGCQTMPQPQYCPNICEGACWKSWHCQNYILSRVCSQAFQNPTQSWGMIAIVWYTCWLASGLRGSQTLASACVLCLPMVWCPSISGF